MMNSKTFLILASFMLVLGATSAHAQSSSDALMSQQQLQAAKEFVETERDMTLIINLDLTPTESETFWPLYEEYRQKVRSIRGRKLTLIEAYDRSTGRNSGASYRRGKLRVSISLKTRWTRRSTS
jgi:hypothetical protein